MRDNNVCISVFMIGGVGFVASVLQIVFFSISSYRFKYSSEEISAGIETSFKTPYVFEILPNKPTLVLNMSLTQQSAFSEYWPGTYEGCNCLGISCYRDGVRQRRLSKGSCNRNETRCGCQDVDSTKGANLTVQNGSEYFKMIDTAQTYANLYKLIDKTALSCPQDYIKCSRNDDPQFDFCV